MIQQSARTIAVTVTTTLLVLPVGAPAIQAQATGFTVTSAAFRDGGTIPLKYAGSQVPGGQNISFPLEWKNLPKGTRSVAVTMVDKTSSSRFLHWLVINIDPADTKLDEGASGGKMPSFATQFSNGYGKEGYGGPAPPSGEEHQYEITVWALTIPSMGMTENSGLKEFESFVQGKVAGKAVLTGIFRRPSSPMPFGPGWGAGGRHR
jgi:Raf kinase inhibitor-like YbhB/YbcL family protein